MELENTDKIWLKSLSDLNEVQRRRFAALRAIEIGWGGITKVSKLTGMSHNTIDKGITEVKSLKTNKPSGRLRKEGGGRKRIAEKNPGIKHRIELILDENTAGDPMSPLKWTNKSTYAITEELCSQGYFISEDTVGRIIKQLDYSLQSNRKSKEGGSSQERDSQFRYINKMVKRCIKQKIPVISVDMKKGKAEIVNVYDFAALGKGQAIPYGIYEILHNRGFVNVGVSHDTSEFSVESIRSWWKNIGAKNYSHVKELLICADCGGSNSSRSRLWKYYLYDFAKQKRLKITVCHYPPGTSKWNKIEHRMFSFISMNWKGKPLRTYEIILNLIQNTTTKTGLKIAAKMDKRAYELGKKISNDEFEKIVLKPHQINPNWNYTLN